MAVMLITINQLIKMCLLILVGVFCYKFKFLSADQSKALSNILLKIVTPLLIVTSFQREFDVQLLKNMLISILMAAVSMGIAYLVSFLLIRRKEGYDLVVERCAATYCNSGFIGYPLAYGIFGSEGLFYMVAFNLVFNLLLFSVGEGTMRGSMGKGFLKQVLLNPVTIASILGVILFVCRIHIPAVIFDPMDMIGSMNSPLAMIVAGVSIAQMNVLKLLNKKRIYVIAAVKLLIIPIVFALIFKFLPIPNLVYMTMVLATACPTATATVLFAVLYGHDHIYASEIFTETVILSVVSIPIVFAIAVL